MKYAKYIDLILKNPRISLFTVVLIPIVILSQFKGFDLSITVDRLINPNTFESKRYFQLKKDFHLGPNILILNQYQNGINEVSLCEYRKWLSRLSVEQDYIKSSFSPFHLRGTVYEKKANSLSSLLFKKTYEFNCELPDSNKYTLTPLKPTPWNDLLFNSANNDFLVDIKLASDEDKNFDSKTVPIIVSQVRDSYFSQFNDIQSYWTGTAVYQFWMKIGLRHNGLLNIGIIFIIIIAFRLFLGTYISSFYFFTTLIYSITTLYGLMSLFDVPIDILNNTIILLLTISSLGDFIFLSNFQIRNIGKTRESFKAMALPSLFTSLTTFIGFISLYSSDLEIIQRLGLWCSISAIIEWFALFTLLPLIVNLNKGKSWVKTNSSILKKLSTIEKFNISKTVSYLLLIFFISAPFAFFKINLKDNPMFLFPKEQEFSKAMQYLEETRGFQGDVSLVFNEPEHRIFNEKVLSTISSVPTVKKIESPYELTDYFTDDLPVLTQRTVLSSIQQSTNYKRLISDHQSRAIIYLRKTSLPDIESLKDYVSQKLCPNDECYLTGRLVSYADFANSVPKTLLTSLAYSLSFVAIIIIILCLYQKQRNILIVLLSSFWGVAFIITFIAISGVSINFVTCAALSILVGLTGDNAIQYLLSVRDLDSGLKRKSIASIITSFIMIVCCSLFLFYYFKPPRDFGIILMLGLASSLIGDLWVLKALKRHMV